MDNVSHKAVIPTTHTAGAATATGAASAIPPSPLTDFSHLHARLSPSERAYARGTLALRGKDYLEAHKQLVTFQRVATPEQSRDVAVILESISLLLAVREEIAIIESSGE